METATSVCLLKTENGNGKLPFVILKPRKRKTEVCFPWSANDEQLSTFFSANVPIYACKLFQPTSGFFICPNDQSGVEK
jgi:hypothetical protein